MEGGIYHVVTRISGHHPKEFVLGEREKQALMRILKFLLRSYYVRIYTYCFMSNHIHLVLTMRRPEEISEQMFLQSFRSYYGRKKELPEGEEECRRLIERWCDISRFMQDLKQRFSRWYNKRNGRKGYLWSDRFKSLILQMERSVLGCMIYVDLNSIRAGISQRPEEYRWSGIWEMWRNDNRDEVIDEEMFLSEVAPETYRRVRRPIKRIDKRIRRRVKENYLWLLYSRGARSKKGKASITEERWREMMEKGIPPEWEIARCRHYTDGCAIGTQEFVQRIYQEHREVFACKREKKGYKMELMGEQVHCLKRLRKA
jgi:REP element-mobilizing transposase RayT